MYDDRITPINAHHLSTLILKLSLELLPSRRSRANIWSYPGLPKKGRGSHSLLVLPTRNNYQLVVILQNLSVRVFHSLTQVCAQSVITTANSTIYGLVVWNFKVVSAGCIGLDQDHTLHHAAEWCDRLAHCSSLQELCFDNLNF